MTSDCLGENRITSAPKRAMSYREQAVAIISIAQHARPIGMGQSEFLRIQLIHASSREKMTFPSTLESYAAGAIVAMELAYGWGSQRQEVFPGPGAFHHK